MTEKSTSDLEQQAAIVSIPPLVDVTESSLGITILADMPGVCKDGLNVRVDNEMLQINGEVTLALQEDMQTLYMEARWPRYHREFALSRELDSTKIDAQLHDGVLKLYIPKRADAQARKVDVKVS